MSTLPQPRDAPPPYPSEAPPAYEVKSIIPPTSILHLTRKCPMERCFYGKYFIDLDRELFDKICKQICRVEVLERKECIHVAIEWVERNKPFVSPFPVKYQQYSKMYDQIESKCAFFTYHQGDEFEWPSLHILVGLYIAYGKCIVGHFMMHGH